MNVKKNTPCVHNHLHLCGTLSLSEHVTLLNLKDFQIEEVMLSKNQMYNIFYKFCQCQIV